MGVNGSRLKQARAAAGLSQRDLAERADVSAMAISKYERDEMTPGSEVLLAIADALGVRTATLCRPGDPPKLELVKEMCRPPWWYGG